MEDVLEDEKRFQVAVLCMRRSKNEEQFVNCQNLFSYFLENVTQQEFIRVVRSERETAPFKT